ncbi:MAG: O-antigen ligase family protein [Actinomycetota bacterium]|nr:O-antigen ligase family protein [Actinomycetota bacterium]
MRSRWFMFATTFLLALMVGVAIARGPMVIALAPIAAIVTVALAMSDVAVLSVILLSTSFLVHPYAFRIGELGSVSPSIGEVGVVVATAAAVLSTISRPRKRLRLGTNDLLIALLMLTIIFGFVRAQYFGVNLRYAVLAARSNVFFMAYFAVRLSVTDRTTVLRLARLVGGLVIIASVASVGQAYAGESARFFLVGNLPEFLRSETAGQLMRVRPPSLTLSYVASCFAASALAFGVKGGRSRTFAAIVLCAGMATIALSLNRNMFLGLGAGLLLTLASTRDWRATTRVVSSLGAILIGAVAPLWAYFSGVGWFSRILSIGDYASLASGTLADRFYENGLALAAIQASPVLGIGWGVDYGARYVTSVEGFVVSDPRLWIHNQYLGLWLRIGLLGLLSMLLLLASGVRQGVDVARLRCQDSWIGAGAAVALIALASSALVGMYFSYGESIVPLCLVLGVAQFVWHEYVGVRVAEVPGELHAV